MKGVKMKRYVGIIIAGVLIFAIVVGFFLFPFMGSHRADACNMGSPGGQDYVPERRGPAGTFSNRPSLTKEQAYDVVANHIKKLNPALEIGQIRDGGSFYEAEILADGKEVIERLAVDKESGRIRLIN